LSSVYGGIKSNETWVNVLNASSALFRGCVVLMTLPLGPLADMLLSRRESDMLI
jgi:hypothetical protein